MKLNFALGIYCISFSAAKWVFQTFLISDILKWFVILWHTLCSMSYNNVTTLFICNSFQSVFDDLEGEEMRRARTRSNPYETIRGAFFLNRWVVSPHAYTIEAYLSLNFCFLFRAAMKMANMDHVFDYMFTNPKDSQGVKPQLRNLWHQALKYVL